MPREKVIPVRRNVIHIDVNRERRKFLLQYLRLIAEDGNEYLSRGRNGRLARVSANSKFEQLFHITRELSDRGLLMLRGFFDSQSCPDEERMEVNAVEISDSDLDEYMLEVAGKETQNQFSVNESVITPIQSPDADVSLEPVVSVPALSSGSVNRNFARRTGGPISGSALPVLPNDDDDNDNDNDDDNDEIVGRLDKMKTAAAARTASRIARKRPHPPFAAADDDDDDDDDDDEEEEEEEEEEAKKALGSAQKRTGGKMSRMASDSGSASSVVEAVVPPDFWKSSSQNTRRSISVSSAGRSAAMKEPAKRVQPGTVNPARKVSSSGVSLNHKVTTRGAIMISSSSRARASDSEKNSKKKKNKRLRPGERALTEIRQLQTRVDFCLRKRPFLRLVKEIVGTREEDGLHYRFQPGAIEALQEAAEAYLISQFELGILTSIHARRVTLMNKDMALVQRIGGGPQAVEPNTVDH
eukprot:ANDGO_00196.mRNA.1 Histone H3